MYRNFSTRKTKANQVVAAFECGSRSVKYSDSEFRAVEQKRRKTFNSNKLALIAVA
jgi:hypothetical protein